MSDPEYVDPRFNEGSTLRVLHVDETLRGQLKALSEQLSQTETTLNNVREDREDLRTLLKKTQEELRAATLDAQLYKRHLKETADALKLALDGALGLLAR